MILIKALTNSILMILAIIIFLFIAYMAFCNGIIILEFILKHELRTDQIFLGMLLSGIIDIFVFNLVLLIYEARISHD